MTPPLIYLDANVFVAAFETPNEGANPVQRLFRALVERRPRAISSELTLAELLAPIRRPHALSGPERKSLYYNLFVRQDVVELKPVSRDILIKTATLRGEINYKLPDAIHVATAIEASCASFASNDERLKQFPAGLRKIRADERGVDELLRALSP